MSIETTPPGKEEVVSATPNLTPPGKKFSRRKIIALAGTGTFVLVVGGGVWRAADQGVFSTGQGPAYEPWDDWRSTTQGPLNLIRAAILAANPHNSQPWLFHVTSTQINLFADLSRNLGPVDPFLIEMHIGLGAALENLLLTAAANGYTTQVTLSPDALDATLVARIGLKPGSAPVSNLYNMIPLRGHNRSARVAYGSVCTCGPRKRDSPCSQSIRQQSEHPERASWGVLLTLAMPCTR